jgi:hypothetical protein
MGPVPSLPARGFAAAVLARDDAHRAPRYWTGRAPRQRRAESVVARDARIATATNPAAWSALHVNIDQ